MLMLIILLILSSASVYSQEFEDVLPEGDYYSLEFKNFEAMTNITLVKNRYSERYIKIATAQPSTPSFSPNAFSKFAPCIRQLFLASKIKINQIIEEDYLPSTAWQLEYQNKGNIKRFVYEEDEKKKIAEFEEYPESIVIIRITNLKDMLKRKILERSQARDLKKGAIISYEERGGIASAFIYLASPELLVFADNKLTLNDFVKVKEGHLPSMRGTEIDQFIRDNKVTEFSSWRFLNNNIRIKKIKDYADKKLKADTLLKSIDEAGEKDPSFTLSCFHLSDKYQENHIKLFHSLEAAQEEYDKETAENNREYSYPHDLKGRQYQGFKKPFYKVKADLSINGNQLKIEKILTSKDFEEQLQADIQQEKQMKENTKRNREEFKKRYPGKYKEYMEEMEKRSSREKVKK